MKIENIEKLVYSTFSLELIDLRSMLSTYFYNILFDILFIDIRLILNRSFIVDNYS